MSNLSITHDTITTTLRNLILTNPDPSPRMIAYSIRKILMLNTRETIHKTAQDRKRIERRLSRRITAERIAS